MSDSSPWLAILAAALATYFWRALGVAVAGRIATNGALFEWVGCVAYALLAALVSRMIVLPIGPLQHTDLSWRLIAAGVALAVFFLTRRGILPGVIAGTAALIGLSAIGRHLL